jgi:hypothetical protein
VVTPGQEEDPCSISGGGSSSRSSVAWPLAARAEQPALRRVGVLMAIAAGDPEARLRVAAFEQATDFFSGDALT